MEKYRIDISDPAETDLRDIVRYISSELSAPTTAIKMMEDIEKAVAKPADMPNAYPSVIDDRLSSMGYRKLLIKNYIVFFSINEKEKVVDVEHILYVRHDWLTIL